MGAAGCPGSMGWTRPYTMPKDFLTKKISDYVTKPSMLRDHFSADVYQSPPNKKHQISDLMRALPICVKADDIAADLRRSKREATADEQKTMDEAERLRDLLIQVDVFDAATAEEAEPGYVRPAIQGTAEMLAKADAKNFQEATA